MTTDPSRTRSASLGPLGTEITGFPLGSMPPSSTSRGTSPSAVTSLDARPERCSQTSVNDLPHIRQRNPVLGALGTGDAGHHAGEVELEHLAEAGDLRLVGAEHALFLRVALDHVDVLGVAARPAKVFERAGVDGEQRRGRAELRRHVGEGRPVGHRHRGQPAAAELDELVDHAVPAEHLGEGEHEGRSRWASAGQRVWKRTPTTMGRAGTAAARACTPRPRCPRRPSRARRSR